MISFNNLASKHRTFDANQNLGCVLALIAGFINAGGFFIVQQYTSHMTGILSIAADGFALGDYTAGLLMLGFMGCFICGASITTLIVLNARQKHLHAQYALPLLLEGVIIIFILFLHQLMVDEILLISLSIALLCFVMGLQNALITKVSTAVIRTTHVTGMTTDLGIEIGRILSSRVKGGARGNVRNAGLHCLLISLFFIGGVIGAVCVSRFGVNGLLPTSLLLLLVSFAPVARDFRFARRRRCRRNRASRQSR